MEAAVRPGPAPPAAGQDMMQAIVQRRYGTVPEDVLRLEQTAKPVPAPDEVLVRVRAAGVDRGTWHLMAGPPYLARTVGFRGTGAQDPVPGWAVAGTVEAVGEDVTELAPGDEVFGTCRGSFAQYATARPDRLAPKPASLTFEQAAAMPISAVAALRAIRDQAKVRPGQHVLVIGASGGVGTFAVQIAKAFGAEVTGACSTAKTDLVGRSAPTTCWTTPARTPANRYDVVIDIGGNRPAEALAPGPDPARDAGHHRRRERRSLARRAWAATSAPTAVPFVSQRLTGFIARERRADLLALGDLADSGAVTPGRRPGLPAQPGRRRAPSPGRRPCRGKVVISLSPASR